MKKYFCLFFILFFSLPLFSRGADFSNVVINEIAWMGTTNSANDEWLELYNNSQNLTNLDGWILKSDDGSPEIKLSGTIPANEFYLLERTDDATIPGMTANLIYKGALENSGEILKLYDNAGNLVDEINCSAGWLAGDNLTKQTMERVGTTNWQTSQNPGGTPKAKNSQTEVRPPPSKTPELTPESVEVEPPLTYASGIVFNEILPSPQGSDSEEEFIEIFNQNNFEADISGWKIEDTVGKTTAYVFPEKTKISPRGFLLLLRPKAKITLNNDGDGLNFIQPDGKITDAVSYEKAKLGQSYNKTPSGWVWSLNLTPGETNIIPENPKTDKTEDRPPTASTEDKPLTADFIEKQTASVGKKIPRGNNFLSILLIAIGIAIFSGVIILILKKKISQKE